MVGATLEMIQKGTGVNRKILWLFIIMHVLQSTFVVGSGESVEWYKLEPELSATNGSLVSSLLAGPQSTVITCVWTRIAYFRRPSVVLSVGNKQASIGDVSIGMVPRGVLLKQGRSVWAAAAMITPLSWYHLCLIITPSKASLLMDGRRLLQVNAVTDYLSGQVRIIVGGSVKWPDIPPTTFTLTSPSEDSWDALLAHADYNSVTGSFAGELLNPQVWNVSLTDQVINRLSECKAIDISPMSNFPGWKMEGSTIQQSSLNSTEPCRRKKFDYILFPEPMKYTENSELCLRMDMDMIGITASEQATLYQDAQKYQNLCGDGEKLLWLATDDENCFSLSKEGRKVAPCKTLLCGGCQIKAGYRRLFVLRGLCPVPEFDFAFVAAPNYDSRPYFQGAERYNIQSNGTMWELRDVTTAKVLATTTGNYPVGTKVWTLAPGTCGNEEELKLQATLSNCQIEKNSCRSGECVAKSTRCDGYPHCSDGFDEEDCLPVRTPTGYLKSSPPPVPPAEVTLTIDVVRVVSTDPFSLLLKTQLEWEDPRLTFSNLLSDTEYPLPLSATMWRPRLMVLADQSTAPVDMVLQASDFGDDEFEKSRASLTARTMASPMDDRRDTPTMDTIYPGTNTTITLSEYVSPLIDCYFDLSFYPFDVQVCELTMVMVPHGIEHAQLVISPNGARYIGETKLNDFYFEEVNMREQDAKLGGRNHSGIILQIRISRQSGYIVLAVILPSFLLLIITTTSLWMTFPRKSSLRLVISCCCTGGFFTFWIIAAISSPKSGKVKALDVWLCFCTMHSVLHALLHVFLNIFGKDEPEPLFSKVMTRAPSRMREVKPVESGSIYDNLMRVNDSDENWTVDYLLTLIGKVVSPVIVILFNAAFWPFVFYFSRTPLP